MKLFNLLFLLVFSAQLAALDCDKAVSTLDVQECAKAEQERVEKELNLVYKRVLKEIEKIDQKPSNDFQVGLKKKFIEAQRTWIKFREADCQNVYAYWSEGTIRGAMYISCMQNRAEQRIKELKEYEEY